MDRKLSLIAAYELAEGIGPFATKPQDGINPDEDHGSRRQLGNVGPIGNFTLLHDASSYISARRDAGMAGRRPQWVESGHCATSAPSYGHAMLERVPQLKFFSNTYWNQMGADVYGNIGTAFRAFLADTSRLPDGGTVIRRQVYGELMTILDSDDYDRWVKLNRTNIETIKAVGGRFIMPDDVKSLMAILDENFDPDA